MCRLSWSWIKRVIMAAAIRIVCEVWLPCYIWMAVFNSFILLIKHALLFLNLLILDLLERQVFITVNDYIASCGIVIDVIASLWILLWVVATNDTYPVAFVVEVIIWPHSVNHRMCSYYLFVLCMCILLTLVAALTRHWIIVLHSVSWVFSICDICSCVLWDRQIVITTSWIFNFMMLPCGISLIPRCFRRFIMMRLDSVNVLLMFSERVSSILEIVVFHWWTWSILLLRIFVSNWARLLLFTTILNLR